LEGAVFITDLLFVLIQKVTKKSSLPKANATQRKTLALQALMLLAEESWDVFAPQWHRRSVGLFAFAGRKTVRDALFVRSRYCLLIL